MTHSPPVPSTLSRMQKVGVWHVMSVKKLINCNICIFDICCVSCSYLSVYLPFKTGSCLSPPCTPASPTIKYLEMAFFPPKKVTFLRLSLVCVHTRTTRKCPSKRCQRNLHQVSCLAQWRSFWTMTLLTSASLGTESR